ncbi:PLP-dependent aminotransferase family protein [Methylobacterium indicum]|uniref:8-amino-7-oxononanoate synthase n=1 Tax=Methylobacterium indicum TaxID=1775910 RepID=A0A8H8WYL4_9HYPH|nr:PLP-dependent aminotransferase family protein [Methylobacterium indicum]BCM86834.1 GntR family transcriptional regulator [Methylobacterium indicum]
MPTDIAWRMLFGGRSGDEPALRAQIGRMVSEAIAAGLLAPGARLPSSRGLAAELGLARNTVVAAYDALIDAGVLVSRDRSGCFVASPGADAARSADPEPSAAGAWPGRFAIRPSRLPQITKPRDWTRYPYPFLFGQFDASLFPVAAWRESVKAASSVKEINGWSLDQVDDDDRDLIEQLRMRVLPRRGILAAPGEIMVTIGSQHALSLLVQLLVARRTVVGLEDPGYTDTRNMVGLASDRIRPLARDGRGIVPDAAFRACDVAFVTIGHQCPTTAVTPLSRRRELLAAAAEGDVVLVEDDYEADLSTEEEVGLPSLKSLDADGRVIHVGSFSKVLAPGLRVGYVVAPSPVVDELRALRRLMLRHPPTNNQRSLAAFVALGHYRAHLARTAAVLRQRADLIAALAPQLMPGCTFRRGFGAKSFWAEGPAGLDARALGRALQREGVLIEPGDIFFMDPEQGRRFFRLGFTAIPLQQIEPGLRRLAAVLAARSR